MAIAPYLYKTSAQLLTALSPSLSDLPFFSLFAAWAFFFLREDHCISIQAVSRFAVNSLYRSYFTLA